MEPIEIVRRIAGMNPIYVSGTGERYCFFCQQYQENEVDERHEPDCLFVAAKEAYGRIPGTQQQITEETLTPQQH